LRKSYSKLTQRADVVVYPVPPKRTADVFNDNGVTALSHFSRRRPHQREITVWST